MAVESYDNIKEKIVKSLLGRDNGSEIQPINHQEFALALLEYIRNVELISGSTLIGIAHEDTVPVQSNDANECYISAVAQDRIAKFTNFINQDGSPITITTGVNEAKFVVFVWNRHFWDAVEINGNIISHAENANFYYQFTIKKNYDSIADMNADAANPMGIDGKPLKIGDIITVNNPHNEAENGIYSWNNGTWIKQAVMNFMMSRNLDGGGSNNTGKDKIQLRRDTKAKWEQVNPILSSGEIGFELDSNNFKIGDGAKHWSELEYSGTKLTNFLSDNENVGLSSKGAKTYLVPKDDIANDFGDSLDRVVSQSFLTKISEIVDADRFKPQVGNITPATMRSAIPESLRKPGLIITYHYGGTSVLEQFENEDKTKWNVSSNWKNLKGGFKIRTFDGIVTTSVSIKDNMSSVEDGEIVFDVNRRIFLQKQNGEYYKNYSRNSLYNNEDNTAVLPGVLFFYRGAIVYNDNNNTIFLEIKADTVDDLVTNSAKPLAASQGVRIKKLLDDGYKFFGLINSSSTIQRYEVKGFYLLIGEGTYNLPATDGKCPKLEKGESGICTTEDNIHYTYIKLPYLTEKDKKDILSKFDNFESIKTQVLTEDEYNGLKLAGNLESNKFYFTLEE